MQASDHLRDDPEILSIAVQKDACALYFGSPRVKMNRDIVKLAVQRNGYALRYAKLKLKRDDREILLLAIRTYVDALEFASDELRSDLDELLSAVTLDGSALMYANSNFVETRSLFWLPLVRVETRCSTQMKFFVRILV